MTTFVDRVELHVAAGNGGHGCASVHREKFKPLGGPDGGNGGRGGDVILVVDQSVTTLLDYHHRPHRKATNGKPGEGGNRSGKDGQDLVLPVPDGTVVLDRQGNVLADLVGQGTTYVAAQGGRGGLGNAALASARRKAPGFALLGEPGEARRHRPGAQDRRRRGAGRLPERRQVLADLGAVAPPSRRSPTTPSPRWCPNLGVVTAGSTVYTIADVPGLIPGASQGKGLGLEFLRHVERCCGARARPGHRDAGVRPRPGLRPRHHRGGAAGSTAASTNRPRIVVLNKIDVPDGKDLAEMVRPDLEARGYRVFEVSAVAHMGLKELSFALAEHRRQGARRQARRRRRPGSSSGPRPWTTRASPSPRGGRALPGARREARALGAADRLQQRRGRRLPRRPPQPPRCRGRADEGGRPRGRRRRHRPRGQRGRLRLGADRWRPAPRCSAGVARTTASRRPARPRSAAATGRRSGTRPTRSTTTSSPSDGRVRARSARTAATGKAPGSSPPGAPSARSACCTEAVSGPLRPRRRPWCPRRRWPRARPSRRLPCPPASAGRGYRTAGSPSGCAARRPSRTDPARPG